MFFCFIVCFICFGDYKWYVFFQVVSFHVDVLFFVCFQITPAFFQGMFPGFKAFWGDVG